MVYEDESSNDYSSLMYISSSDDGMQYQIPPSDHDYVGVETTPLVSCEHHGLAAERHVAFEGFDTGRSFLVSANKLVAMNFKLGVVILHLGALDF
ncbi:hypothetical protein D1007_30179 [Hordeum vulgare]|nr:hypothetical protein D1007_30179 [Hordeum vulgare]